MKDTDKTKVVFRCWKDTGDVIALFPEILADTHGSCQSFEHVGQHGAATYNHVVNITRPAEPFEYFPLKKELESPPYEYHLDVRQKASGKMHDTRLADLRRTIQ